MVSNYQEYEIRLMTEDDILDVINIRKELRYTEGAHFIRTLLEYDPEGFYVASTKDGKVIGSCAGVLQHDDLAFIGLYSVKSNYQGHGIGTKLWNKVMERVGDRNIGINASPELFTKYSDRSGFSVNSEWRALNYIAKEVQTSAMISKLPGIYLNIVHPKDVELVRSVAQYDADVLNFSRGNLLSLLCGEKESLTMVAIKASSNSICGYGMIKRCILGEGLVGPLFADNICIAEMILHHLTENFADAKTQSISLNIIDCNKEAVKMAETLDFKVQEAYLRLYTRKNVKVHYSKVFSLYNLSSTAF